MFRRLILIVATLVVLQCAFGKATVAQNTGNCPFITWVMGYPDPIPAGAILVDPSAGPTFFRVGAYKCQSSPAAAGETCPFCPQANSPISLATGDTYIQQNDIRLPGLSNGLRLDRTWNSVWPTTQLASQIGVFGPNWRSTFEERVFLGSDGFMKYSRSDGSFWSFPQGVSPASLAAPANITATLTSGTSYWTIT